MTQKQNFSQTLGNLLTDSTKTVDCWTKLVLLLHRTGNVRQVI